MIINTKTISIENPKTKSEGLGNQNFGKITENAGKDIGKNLLMSDKTELLKNFNDENGKFEYFFSERIGGGLILKEKGTELGNLGFSIRDNCLYIDSLISFQKGSGTLLIQKLVEISELLGKGGHIEAQASFYRNPNVGGQQSYRNQKGNLGFYYKLGFEAKNSDIHREIMEYINRGEEIPLKLNMMTDIYLTDEGIKRLKK